MTDRTPLHVALNAALDSMLAPLRLPARLASDVRTLGEAAASLQAVATHRLGSIDELAREIALGLRELRGTIERVAGRVGSLESLESTLTTQLDGLRVDLNERMIAVEEQVRAMRPSMDQMARDVNKINQLLPDPSDGPVARLKDALTAR